MRKKNEPIGYLYFTISCCTNSWGNALQYYHWPSLCSANNSYMLLTSKPGPSRIAKSTKKNYGFNTNQLDDIPPEYLPSDWLAQAGRKINFKILDVQKAFDDCHVPIIRFTFFSNINIEYYVGGRVNVNVVKTYQ